MAEGFGKKGLAEDKIRLLDIAQDSLEESRYYLILANDLESGNTSELLLSLEKLSKLLDLYIAAIEQRRQSPEF
ncbi:four helix bundle protein [Dapis sp. BLCC M126]|uniref:four helix bundle protein n=1 Tax=Dapis sp. BLCC M126 TaxID=3400189 RepID=UPI003CF82A7D